MKISINNFEKESYEIALGELLGILQNIEKRVYHSFDEKVRNVCGVNYNSIFDMNTGGIKIFDYEWVQDNSVYKKAFSYKESDSLCYAIHLEDSILLRGPQVYYYLVTHKEQYHNPTDNQVLEWKKNIERFISKCIEVILESKNAQQECNNLLEKKFLLGILDHIRHFLLIFLNSELVIKNEKTHSFVEVISDDSSLKLYFDYIDKCYQLFEELLFYEFNREKILNQINALLQVCSGYVSRVFSMLLFRKNEKLYGRCLKLHREADCMVENYVTVKYSIDEQMKRDFGDGKNAFQFWGVLSGAIELPILFYHFLKDKNHSYCYVSVLGDYLQRHSAETENSKDTKALLYKGVLLDDNAMTGETIDVACQYIKEEAFCDITDFFILRHPELNRIPQMKAYNKAVDINVLKEHCLGLINHSPYSKIKDGTNYHGEFLDELGVFTLTGEFFLRYLFKNGLYKKNSEVDRIGMRRKE